MVRRTVLVSLPSLGSLYVKPESEQPTGSFKIRGAANAVSRLAESGRIQRIVVHSSGNFAQSVAYMGRRFGIGVTAVLPDTAPALKVEAIHRLGANIERVPPGNRETEALRVAAQTRATLLQCDDFDVIAGVGASALELIADLPEVGTVLVPVCTGGQLAGISAALKSIQPAVQVLGVEPELAADAADSFRQGRLVSWPTSLTYRTVADGLRSPAMGRFAWEHVRRYADNILTVSEDAIVAASSILFSDAGLIAEPSGAVATAAFMEHRHLMGTKPTVAIVTGGNVVPGQ
jgi:threonine dehydratase